jgi:hypothetical protein
VAFVRERTIPTERPPLVGEVNANFCGYRVPRGQQSLLLYYSYNCLSYYFEMSLFKIHAYNVVEDIFINSLQLGLGKYVLQDVTSVLISLSL